MFSYSKLDCYKQCPKKYKYRYIDKLSETNNKFLEFGTEFHKAISNKKSNDINIELMINSLYNNNEFKKYVNKILYFEKKIFFKNKENDKFISILDAVGKDFVLEFKSSKEKWTEEMFNKELQSSLYLEAFRQEFGNIKKLIYFIVTKPNKKYFPEVQFREVNYNKDKLKELSNIVTEIKNDKIFNKKINKYCYFCSFYEICNK